MHREKLARLQKLMEDNPETFEGLANTTWFRFWLKNNMHIYQEFENYATEIRYNGKRDRYSARMILHRMRWDTLFQEAEPTNYKICNDCTPYLARLVMLNIPTLDGMFRLKNSYNAEMDTL